LINRNFKFRTKPCSAKPKIFMLKLACDYATDPLESTPSVSLLPIKEISERPKVDGKFLNVDGKRFWLKGVTYGTFDSTKNDGYPDRNVVEQDFCAMARNGFNCFRTYTIPPAWLLDLAYANGLRAIVGIPWEQHITFLNDHKTVASIRERVRRSVRECKQHPAILCYTIGNEVPAPIARWHGKRELESFLYKLYLSAKEEDPDGLVTYVNFPSTEYLDLPFLDLVCFNVYIEQEVSLDAYLARLQHLAGNRPIVLAEIGLDSQRHGEQKQCWSLERQIRCAMSAGCAGALVFAWTDEWHRGGCEIADWDFGLTTRDRQPKLALGAVADAFVDAPFASIDSWPRISVVVCTYNGSRTLRECLSKLRDLDYPDYEVIVVNDGSSDHCAEIAEEFPVRLITTSNRGLSAARNTGYQAASGEIVAYIDDDAYPDIYWLRYLAISFSRTSHAAIGGPNVGPAGDGFIAECVLNAPGGPVHVMLDDTHAEHIPGCNMAFRKEALEALGGFDPQFRVAGDDVDICWQIQERGWSIGFSPAALVWHHRRNSVRTYWRQQFGYGKSEALLERKWPEKYNCLGHAKWAGRIYGNGLSRLFNVRTRIYHGLWGSAPFQTQQKERPNAWCLLPAMPEWYFVTAILLCFAGLSAFWPKLRLAIPLFFAALTITLGQAGWSAFGAVFPSRPRTRRALFARRGLTAVLHVLQPIARLLGRTRHGLTLWRKRLPSGFLFPRPQTLQIWSEDWQQPESRLMSLKAALRKMGALSIDGGDYDRWDMEVPGGAIGKVRILMVVEEHGSGKQMFRFRLWPSFNSSALVLTLGLTLLAVAAYFDGAREVFLLLLLFPFLLGIRAIRECGSATSVLHEILRRTH
jgi:glycosyltransferase involved in cell wall biosynthesis